MGWNERCVALLSHEYALGWACQVCRLQRSRRQEVHQQTAVEAVCAKVASSCPRKREPLTHDDKELLTRRSCSNRIWLNFRDCPFLPLHAVPREQLLVVMRSSRRTWHARPRAYSCDSSTTQRSFQPIVEGSSWQCNRVLFVCTSESAAQWHHNQRFRLIKDGQLPSERGKET